MKERLRDQVARLERDLYELKTESIRVNRRLFLLERPEYQGRNLPVDTCDYIAMTFPAGGEAL